MVIKIKTRIDFVEIIKTTNTLKRQLPVLKQCANINKFRKYNNQNLEKKKLHG